MATVLFIKFAQDNKGKVIDFIDMDDYESVVCFWNVRPKYKEARNILERIWFWWRGIPLVSEEFEK